MNYLSDRSAFSTISVNFEPELPILTPTPAGVLIDLFKDKVQKIFLLCGRISGEVISRLPKNVHFIEMNKFFSNEKESIANYKEGISKSCKEIIKELSF